MGVRLCKGITGVATVPGADSVSHLARLRCGEEHRLPLLGQQLDDLPHLVFETLLQNAVCFVDNQALRSEVRVRRDVR
jgi:hypothetical protein